MYIHKMIAILFLIIFKNCDGFLVPVKDPCALPDHGNCEQICTSLHGQITCECFPGFQLINSTCTDVDECSNPNHCSHTCENLPGSYRCVCNYGYRLEDESGNCRDVNECLLNNGHGPCQDTCRNTNGSYECACELPNSHLALDGHKCIPDDACIDSGCTHLCISARGTAFCFCPIGMVLDVDWKTCNDINECELEEFKQLCPFNCINTIGSYYCTEELTEEQEITTEEQIIEVEEEQLIENQEIITEETIIEGQKITNSSEITTEVQIITEDQETTTEEEIFEEQETTKSSEITTEDKESTTEEQSFEEEETTEKQEITTEVQITEDQETTTETFEEQITIEITTDVQITEDQKTKTEEESFEEEKTIEGQESTTEPQITKHRETAIEEETFEEQETTKTQEIITEDQETTTEEETFEEQETTESQAITTEAQIIEDQETTTEEETFEEQETTENQEITTETQIIEDEETTLYEETPEEQITIESQEITTEAQITETVNYEKIEYGETTTEEETFVEQETTESQEITTETQITKNEETTLFEETPEQQETIKNQKISTEEHQKNENEESTPPEEQQTTTNEEITTEYHQKMEDEKLRTSTTKVPRCEPLELPINGRFTPISCTSTTSSTGNKCRLSCRRGYKPAPWITTPILQCDSSTHWQPQLTNHQLTTSCIRTRPKPFLNCLNHNLTFTLNPGERITQVRIPSPETNLDWNEIFSKPAWGMRLNVTLTIGQYEVTFFALDSVDHNSSVSCSITILVQDLEPPTVIHCPSDLRLRLPPRRHGQTVHWKEPHFVDNVAVTEVYQTKYSGDYFHAGTHRVEYGAKDGSGNSARCQFVIYLEEATILTHGSNMILVCPGGVHTLQNVQRYFQMQIQNIEKGCYWRRTRNSSS